MKMTVMTALRRFLRDTRGNVTIETLFWLPLILSVLAATFSLYDAYRYRTLNTKATYTISDAISRETETIDGPYLDGMVDLMEFLTRSEGPYSVRVSQVRGTGSSYEIEWSKTRGEFNELQSTDVTSMTTHLPVLLKNERVIVVETETDYRPVFVVPGLNEQRLFYTYSFTRPRFAPQVVWSGA